MRNFRLLFALCAFLITACASNPKATPTADDPNLWLEDIEGQKPLEWVKERNKTSLAELEGDRRFQPLRKEILQIITAKDRIPSVQLMNGTLYNFWQDEKHVRGIWRKTTLADFKKSSPHWTVVLDLDALAKKENENWVWKGAECHAPKFNRCMLHLSRGGKDATVEREFDVSKKDFVAGGFLVPEAKNNVTWKDEDTLYVGTDFGPGSLTDSGYPAQVHVWKRGTSLASSKMIYKCEPTDIGCSAFVTSSPEGDWSWIQRDKTFFTAEFFSVSDDFKLTHVDIPEDVIFQAYYKGMTILSLRKPWEEWQSGDLIAIDKAGKSQLVLRASERGSIAGVSRSRDALYIDRLENVIGEIDQAKWDGTSWKIQRVKLPAMGATSLQTVSPFEDQVFYDYEDFLTPPSLYWAPNGLNPQKIKSLPERFSSKGLQVTQLEATSRDGTKVPYFLVLPKNWDKKPRPTILNGYGGFEISETPRYLSTSGKTWLEKGGLFALANIRGGGEFGPKWHQAALKEKRQAAYDDFIAVGEDLIKRGYTTHEKLGIRGGSNGGLLTGTVFVERPDLFGAVLCQVPLLDMLRYNKLLAGASWMAEYGDPADPVIHDFWMKHAPYQNVKADVKYPRVFFMTSTKDDRVHPGHARKMVAKMMAQNHPVLYFENTEGGHSAAANLEQRARMEALGYVYFFRQLPK